MKILTFVLFVGFMLWYNDSIAFFQKDGYFTQALYEKGKLTPEEAKFWEIGFLGEQFNWDIDYWERFDSLQTIYIYSPFSYDELKRFFELGEFPHLKRLGIFNYYSKSLPSELFEGNSIKYFRIENSHIKELPKSFYDNGGDLKSLFIEDCPAFSELNENNIAKFKNLTELSLGSVDLLYIPQTIQELKKLEWLDIANINKPPDVPDISFHNINYIGITPQVALFWDYKQGCLDTMPVIVKKGTDSLINFLTLTCIRNFPDNKAYLKSFRITNSSIRYIDVTNQRTLPYNIEYYHPRFNSINFLNPHTLHSLEGLNETIEGIAFTMSSGPLSRRDFERLIKELTKLNQLKRVRFREGVPGIITIRTRRHIRRLDFLETMYFEDEKAGRRLERYLPDIIEYKGK